ncbi:hypothetical protein PPYR_05674 [Photinus pyralis]|uniref:Uncharacterized protein n=2 Tax=Photinus pyralis TaxID=7054 RepID=A0A5N4AVR4_PHOPY|nr:DNA-directed RNA polymerase II subunit RPB1-like [Photinus pyralis]KAB0801320.1 hypothetical protein PPYR_05674 [Photinus pyralis]
MDVAPRELKNIKIAPSVRESSPQYPNSPMMPPSPSSQNMKVTSSYREPSSMSIPYSPVSPMSASPSSQGTKVASSYREPTSVSIQYSPLSPMSSPASPTKEEHQNCGNVDDSDMDNILGYMDEEWLPNPLFIVSDAMRKFKELKTKYEQKLEEHKAIIAGLEWKLKIFKTRNLYAKNNLRNVNLIFNKWKTAVKSVYEY